MVKDALGLWLDLLDMDSRELSMLIVNLVDLYLRLGLVDFHLVHWLDALKREELET